MQQNYTIFYDGATSEQQSVQVNLRDGFLEIIKRATGEKISWNYPEIEIEEKPHDDRDGVISYSKTPHARLYLDAETFREIIRKIPKSKSKALRLSLMIFIAVFAIIGLVFFAIPALAPVLLPKIPTSWDKKLGDYAARYFIDKEKICTSAEGDAALKKIASAISADNFDYELKLYIQKDDMVNAFALPGGKIVIFSKLLDEIESQDELVGILAHEAAHVQLRHGTANMMRYILTSFVIDIFTGGGGTAIYLGYQFHNLKYSQELESEADAWAVAKLHNLQIDSTAFAALFSRMKQKKEAASANDLKDNILEYLSTHPSDSKRIDGINMIAKELHKNGRAEKYRQILSIQEWQEIKQICN
jgi:Zn-dependent protease with chaperone function